MKGVAFTYIIVILFNKINIIVLYNRRQLDSPIFLQSLVISCHALSGKLQCTLMRGGE